MEFTCSTCKGNNWNIYLRYTEDNQTYLVLSCDNEKCSESEQERLGGHPEDVVIWGEYNITGQGLDRARKEKPN